jgi:hypothetical protein
MYRKWGSSIRAPYSLMLVDIFVFAFSLIILFICLFIYFICF